MALRLGHPNVDQMLRSMTWAQFNEWKTFAALEPFEPERLERVITRVTQTLVNAHRKKGARAYKLEDCMLHFGDAAPVRPKRDWRSMLRIAQILTAESRRQHGLGR